jgi:hypothetical protein
MGWVDASDIWSLLPKLDYIKIWPMQTKPDILVLTETGTFWTGILILRVIMCSELTERLEVVEWPFLFKILSLWLY